MKKKTEKNKEEQKENEQAREDRGKNPGQRQWSKVRRARCPLLARRVYDT